MYVGVDEAGRGAWAGPLVVCGILLQEPIQGLKDSKILTSKRRKQLLEEIQSGNNVISVLFFSPKVIDQIGLSETMRVALSTIKDEFRLPVLFDGNTTYGVQGVSAIVKADEKIESVSAASIVAKEWRDDYMRQLANEYDGYKFEKNVGYGTKDHHAALQRIGVCAVHRMSFKPITELA